MPQRPYADGMGMRKNAVFIPLLLLLISGITHAAPLTSGTVHVYDAGSISSPEQSYSVDVVQGQCGDEPDTEPEPFFNTLIGVELKNNFYRGINLRRFRYRVAGGGGAGRFSSRKLALSSSGRFNPEEEKEVLMLSFLAKDGRKFFHRTDQPISEDLGFRNFRITLLGRDGANNPIQKTVRFALSFGNYDRCAD